MIDIQWFMAYLALGVVVGFFAGLLGVGGGGIMVPALTAMFAAQGLPFEHLVHVSLATSMAAIVVTSASSLRAHQKHGAIQWNIVKSITPGILLGTFGAAMIAAYIPSLSLAIFFVVFMAYVSVQMWLNVKPKPSRQLPSPLGLSGVGLIIGGVSALVAIGGGSLSVPFMTWCNVKIQQAIATSAAIGLPIALAGTLGYLVSGMGVEGLPKYTFGFIYLPAAASIALVSVFTAPLGAKLAHQLPVATLKKVFAVLLIGLSLKMLHTILTR
ncbi:MAG: sulfite exporter TauE/SafE family protein [Thiothrix sp.]|nr:MAG: sulfite exporter TauE/SafE family protein [Thiothrix sp.]